MAHKNTTGKVFIRPWRTKHFFLLFSVFKNVFNDTLICAMEEKLISPKRCLGSNSIFYKTTSKEQILRDYRRQTLPLCGLRLSLSIASLLSQGCSRINPVMAATVLYFEESDIPYDLLLIIYFVYRLSPVLSISLVSCRGSILHTWQDNIFFSWLKRHHSPLRNLSPGGASLEILIWPL